MTWIEELAQNDEALRRLEYLLCSLWRSPVSGNRLVVKTSIAMEVVTILFAATVKGGLQSLFPEDKNSEGRKSCISGFMPVRSVISIDGYDVYIPVRLDYDVDFVVYNLPFKV